MSREDGNSRSAWALWRRNLLVWAALLVLLALTFGLSYAPLGPLNIVVALGIAVAKAGLVLVFFMELRTSSNIIRLAAAGGAVWLFVLFLLTVADYLTRH